MLWKIQRFVEHFLRHFCIIFDHFNADPFKWRSRTKMQVDHFREQVRFSCHLLTPVIRSLDKDI